MVKIFIYLNLNFIKPLLDVFDAPDTKKSPRRPKEDPGLTGGNPSKYAGRRGYERKDGRTERQADRGQWLRSVQTDKFLYFLFLE